jgi:hypothetical protein
LAPLLAIEYDASNKGDDLVIATGQDDVDSTHDQRFSGNRESQDDNKKVVVMEVMGRDETKTILFDILNKSLCY